MHNIPYNYQYCRKIEYKYKVSTFNTDHEKGIENIKQSYSSWKYIYLKVATRITFHKIICLKYISEVWIITLVKALRFTVIILYKLK